MLIRQIALEADDKGNAEKEEISKIDWNVAFLAFQLAVEDIIADECSAPFFKVDYHR